MSFFARGCPFQGIATPPTSSFPSRPQRTDIMKLNLQSIGPALRPAGNAAAAFALSSLLLLPMGGIVPPALAHDSMAPSLPRKAVREDVLHGDLLGERKVAKEPAAAAALARDPIEEGHLGRLRAFSRGALFEKEEKRKK